MINKFFRQKAYLKYTLLSLSLLFFVLTQTACATGIGGAFEELLSPPRLTDEQYEIYQALLKSKGSGFRLKYPKSGDYRSAFVVQDFDSEPTEEAIVFYEIEGINAERALWLNFMDQDENKEWRSVYELAVTGTEIERVIFTPLGADDKTNIIICYSINQSEKGFAVLRYSGQTPERILEDNYSYLGVDDYFDEGRELLVIKTDHNVETSTAIFYSMNDGLPAIKRSCALNPDAHEYTGAFRGNLDENTEAIIINYKKYENSEQYGTDVLVTRRGILVNPIWENPDNIELVTRRTNPLTAAANPRDIDDDGFTELCSSVAFPGYSSRAQADRVYATVWRSLKYNTLETKYYSYYNEKSGFIFIMPSRWQNLITAEVSPSGARVTFFAAEKSVVDSTVALLSIRAVSSDIVVPDSEGWTLYAENEKLNIKYYVMFDNPRDPLALTEDEMEYGFRILD